MAIVLPHLKAGGAERTASELANFLAAKGDSVTLVLMYRREKFFSLDPAVHLVEPGWGEQRWGKVINVIHILLYLRKVLRNERPALIFSIGYMAFTLASALGLSSRVIISGRSSPQRVRFPGSPVLNMMYGLIHRALSVRVDGVIAQTAMAAERYRKLYRCPVEVIPNFLRKLQLNSIERSNWIVNVGRCDKEKGQDLLLIAFARLKAADWELVIVGDGPQRTQLEAQASQLGIASRVRFEGFRKDVDSYLGRAKIFAFTSLHEGFPNALLEAMATPLPCVSFNCVAGPSDIICDGENGFLVPVGDLDGLTDRLQRLVDNESLRVSLERQALSTRSTYDISRVGERYRDFFVKISNLN